jgi:hypothetical protein
MIPRRVDFPHPLGPSKAITSPEYISNEIPERTFTSAKDFSMFVIWSIGCGILFQALNHQEIKKEG